MSDVLDNVIAPSEQEPAAVQSRPHETTIAGTRLAASMFGIEEEQQVAEPSKVETPAATTETPAAETAQPAATTAADPNEEILDPKDWLKREFEIDDPEVLKQQIKEYRELKAKPQTEAEIKFENEQSQTLHELIRQGKTKEVKEFLDLQERLESYTTGDVSKDNADEIIKMGMKLKYKDLSPEEINYKFNKEYGIPSEPVQAADELDDEFAARKSAWQEKVNDIMMNKVIEAKLMRPELEQAKSKLVLPEIPDYVNQQKPLTPEQIEAAKRYDEAYINSVDSSIKEFNGFSLKVKNEDVGLPEISVAYSVVDNEKSSLLQELKDFAQTGYDANALLAQRWVNKDGTINTKLMAEDRYWLNNREQIVQKVADETAKKAIEAFVKGKKNITLKQGTEQQVPFQDEGKTGLDKVRDSFFGN